jgi:chemotaxis protein methyltransferase CheR
VQAHLNDTDELRELTNCVTTNKTSFFRERHHFDFLTSTLIPQVLSKSAPGAHEPIRIWSAACSTGEEPYTLAITLLEALASRRKPGSAPPLSCAPAGYGAQIVASDIDTQVLAKAARGVYREESLETVEMGLRKKYFLRGTGEMAGHVRVKPELTRMVEFVHLNLMTPQWPMTGPFDAIFFRNALIYFQKETQDVLLRKMARLIKPGGYLFLGNSEHISWLNDIYEPMKQTMYRLRDTAR